MQLGPAGGLAQRRGRGRDAHRGRAAGGGGQEGRGRAQEAHGCARAHRPDARANREYNPRRIPVMHGLRMSFVCAGESQLGDGAARGYAKVDDALLSGARRAEPELPLPTRALILVHRDFMHNALPVL